MKALADVWAKVLDLCLGPKSATPALIAPPGSLQGYVSSAEPVPVEILTGDLPCSALGCPATTAVRCAYVDRRSRACQTAWCPSDRQVVNNNVYCPLHAKTMAGIEYEFGSAPHPDLDSRTVPIIHWISSVVADEVIAILNVYCSLHRQILVAEPVRRMLNPTFHSHIWEKQWKTLSPTDVTMRVGICSDEAKPTEICIKVNNRIVNVVPPPFNKDLTAPTDEDLRWLDQEVLAPIVEAVERSILLAAHEAGRGFIPYEVLDKELAGGSAGSNATAESFIAGTAQLGRQSGQQFRERSA